MPRFFIIVLDGVGAGNAPDAAEYGDEGANTLGNLARAEGGLRLPVMGSMGLGDILPLEGVPETKSPSASWGLARELSKGKDTITGHWEMMGIITATPFPTYPDGFPRELLAAFQKAIGRKSLWGKVASGTEIMERLGDEHVRTGFPIVYTSADSVFQIAAHEAVVAPEELYDMCLKAREILVPPDNVCRVIARPFTGPPFERTPRRRDFPLPPPEESVIDLLAARGVPVVSVGKVSDMFCGRGFSLSHSSKTISNADGMDKLDELLDTLDEGFVFANLVDFDMVWGHRKDTAGFRQGLEDFDKWLGGFINKLQEDDYLLITADHGLDPTHPGTDHTREQVPLLFYGNRISPRALGVRHGFRGIGTTVAEVFRLLTPNNGSSFII